MTHNLDGFLAEEMVFVVGEGLAGGHHDALAGVDAQRVEILHVADGDAVVIAVAHHLVLNLLPAAQGLLDQHLRGEGEGLAGDGLELLLVFAESGAQAAQRVGGAQDDRVADLAGGGAGLLQVGGGCDLIVLMSISSMRSTNSSRSSVSMMACTGVPSTLTPYFSRTPLL